MDPEFEAPHKGDVVGRVYRLETLLDGGLAADVWRAEDTKLKRQVAVKVLRPTFSRDPEVQKRFKREGVIHGNLRHDNIVRVFNADQDERIGLWIAMELMKGSLRKLLASEGPLGPKRTIELLAPIAGALDYAHEKNSVHRDIKPPNILLDDKGRAHLSDFGLATTKGASRLTGTGMMVGTPGYAAPEQALPDEEVDGLADVYSLSVVLFECLTGTMPNPVARAGSAIDWTEVPSASERNPSLPKQIDAVVRKGKSERREDRYASATALIDAAKTALEAPSSPVRSPSPLLPMSRQARLFAAVACVLSLTIGIGAGMASQGDRPETRPRTARNGEVALEVPPGWLLHGGKPSTGGLAIAKPINLEPGKGSDPSSPEMAVTAGMSAAVGPELLAPAYASQPHANRKRRVPVGLGSLQAYRYTGLTAPGSGKPVIVFAAPTTRGVVTVACRTPSATVARRAAGLCERIAGTLRLQSGKRYPLGPSPAFSRALRKRIGRLASRHDKAVEEMRDAKNVADQATAAEDLSAAFDKAATGLAAVRVSPESASGKRGIVQALGAGAVAYTKLADAAGREDEAAYAAAGRLTGEAEDALTAGLKALARLGYSTPGSSAKRQSVGSTA